MRYLILAIFLLFTSPVFAAAWHVREDTTHSGTRNGTSYANAWGGWSEINWASISPDDTIYIEGAHSYSSTISIGSNSSTVEHPIHINGYSSSENGSITLTGSAYLSAGVGYPSFELPITGSASSVIFSYSTEGVKLYNAVLSGGTIGLLNSTAINTRKIDIEYSTIQNQTESGIRWLAPAGNTGNLTSLVFTDNQLKNITGAGLEVRSELTNTVSTVSSLIVQRNTAYGVTGLAFWLYHHREIPGSADYLWGPLSFKNNICGNVGTCLLAGGLDATDWGQNDFIDNTIYNTTLASGPLNIISAKYVTVTGNHINPLISQSSSTTDIDGNGILIDFGNLHVRVSNNEINRMQGKSGVVNSGCALMILNPSDVIEYNNYGTGNKIGIFYGDVSSNAGPAIGSVAMYNNAFLNNTQYGQYVDSALNNTEVSQITSVNNIFTGSGTTTGLKDDSTGGGDIVSNHNVYYNFTTTYSGASTGSGDITTNPDVNTTTYAITMTSPAYDVGTNTLCHSTGIDGTPAPVDTCDIGVWEVANVSSTGSIWYGTLYGTLR